jgi:hypothetical protein
VHENGAGDKRAIAGARTGVRQMAKGVATLLISGGKVQLIWGMDGGAVLMAAVSTAAI